MKLSSRNEFVQRLRSSLSGKVDTATLQEMISYYEDYFDIQLRSGKSEQMILDELGDPRLLAKSIIHAQNNKSTTETYDAETEKTKEKMRMHLGNRMIELPRWLFCIICVIVVMLVLYLVVSAISLLLPFILLFVAVGFLYQLLSDIWRGR